MTERDIPNESRNDDTLILAHVVSYCLVYFVWFSGWNDIYFFIDHLCRYFVMVNGTLSIHHIQMIRITTKYIGQMVDLVSSRRWYFFIFLNFLFELILKDLIAFHWQEGKRQLYRLGQYFRHRYGKILDVKYSWKNVYIQSTDFDRKLIPK